MLSNFLAFLHIVARAIGGRFTHNQPLPVLGATNQGGGVDRVDLQHALTYLDFPVPPTPASADVESDGAVDKLDYMLVVNAWKQGRAVLASFSREVP
ncbi:hypothetical protein OWM54_23805 [Myxococcus sp. MISCRS1]|uniref:hypothetical protein n=1 Tax=Myxococcus sp. MISCRS1 TaxID=2996786 RepID=UPI00226FC742|nr:hypothetical protein [Myxococcus sp. MISCRS1]MCY1000168.1 hypothetical protein [Myxococcus sp. MISCRS1]